MTRVPVLADLQVSCHNGAVHLGCRWAGDQRVHLLILRSHEWFCESTDAHLRGDWGQQLIYEGESRQVIDRQAGTDEDSFYTIFARRPKARQWRHPVRLRVHKAGYEAPQLGLPGGTYAAATQHYAAGRFIDGRYVEITGDDEAEPAIHGSRDWLLLIIPAVTLGLLMGFLTGLDARVITPVALSLAACWRLLDGRQPDLRRFLGYLRVVAAVDLGFWAAAALFFLFASNLPTDLTINGSILLFWLFPLLLVAGMGGVWLIAGRLLDDTGRPTMGWWLAVVGGAIALGFALPPLGCALAASLGLREYVRAARAANAARVARVRALREERRRVVRDTYTPWEDEERDY